MSGNLVESLIGALVLVVAGWFILFAYEHTDVASSEGFQVSAVFDRVDGLSVGSDVRLAGIKVGSVVSQSLNPETLQAIVTFTIQKDLKLYADTAAAITSEGLLGGNYLSLLPGPGIDDEELLTNGSLITNTQPSVDLLGLMGQFMNSDSSKKETP